MTKPHDLNPTISETAFKDLIIEFARLRGWLIHHDRPAQNHKGKWASHIQGDPGFPDLVLARRGRVIFAELKTEKGNLGEHQERWMDELTEPVWDEACADHNHSCPHVESLLVRVWRPSDWDVVQEVLR